MAVQIQFRRGSTSDWSTANTVLAAGEMGIDTTTNQFKIGNGSTAWNSLSYAPINGTVADLDNITNVIITNTAAGQFLKWNGSAWVNDAIDLGSDTTGDYVATITGGTGVTSTAATTGEGTTHSLSIGQAVATNSNVTFNDLTVAGNLTVSGTTTSINTETLTVDDNIVVLNNNVTASPTEDAGIEVERGTSANVVLRWNETADKWQASNDGSVYGDIVTTAVGIAPSATVLATARNIAGQSFDGSANISIAPTDLTGVNTSAAELNFVVGVTSLVQTQLDLKAPLSSPTFTGTPTLPTGTIAVTQSAGNNTVAVATTAYVDAAASAAASGATLDTLSGVVITSPANGQLLQFDGTNFVNATLSLTPDFSDANNVLANQVF